MPRPPRIYPAGVPQHVFNRGNRRERIFRDRADYSGFLDALVLAGARTTVKIVCFCLMTNHWHLILWPSVDGEISTYMQLLMNAHIRDLLARRDLAGRGHFYGGRHSNVPIVTERHYWVACRYVEANARAAGMVERSEYWPWSSVSGTPECARVRCESPLVKPTNWIELANQVPNRRALEEWRRDARKTQKSGELVPLGGAVEV